MNAPDQAMLHSSRPVADASTDRTWPVIAHLSGLAGYLPLPVIGNALGPLVVWLTRGKADPEVEQHARAALNFQITALVAMAVSALLMIVLVGFVLLPLVVLVQVVLTIVGAVKASRGELLDYPFSLTWVGPPRATP